MLYKILLLSYSDYGIVFLYGLPGKLNETPTEFTYLQPSRSWYLGEPVSGISQQGYARTWYDIYDSIMLQQPCGTICHWPLRTKATWKLSCLCKNALIT